MYGWPVALYSSVAMTTQLNALRRLAVATSPTTDLALASGRAAVEIVGTDVAHHVVDPDGRAGLDPRRATALTDALVELAALERETWILTLPQAGALGSLRGPVPLNRAALEVGEAVVGLTAGVALVPYRVGRAVQWRVFGAERPFPPLTPYDAERALSEAVLRAATTLTQLDVAAGPHPHPAVNFGLPAAYSSRQQATAERAARLLVACDAALLSDGSSITSHEAEARARELRTVRAAANHALCASATWLVS